MQASSSFVSKPCQSILLSTWKCYYSCILLPFPLYTWTSYLMSCNHWLSLFKSFFVRCHSVLASCTKIRIDDMAAFHQYGLACSKPKCVFYILAVVTTWRHSWRRGRIYGMTTPNFSLKFLHHTNTIFWCVWHFIIYLEMGLWKSQWLLQLRLLSVPQLQKNMVL